MSVTSPRPIPAIPGLPLLGNAMDMSGDMRLYLTGLYHQHGPVFQLNAMGKPMIVLAGLEANKFVAREGANVLRNHEVWTGVDGLFGVENSILSTDGEPHRRIRKVLRRSFGRGYLEEHLNAAYSVTETELDALNPGQAFSVIRWCQNTVMEQLSQVCTHSTSRPFRQDMLDFLRTVLMVGLLGAWPKAALYAPRYRAARRSVFALADALITWHRQHPAGQEGRTPDLIDDLLEAQQHDPVTWSDDDVRAGTLTAFSAGLDTAASMLAFTLYRLHRHPDVLERVREEADDLFRDGPPTLERLGRAPHLHGAVLETLRLHPIAPALSRFSAQAFDFSGYRIPAGVNVMVGSSVAHGLPDIYPDPDAFDPARFGPQRAEHRRQGAFTPFGIGAHTCLGSGMAEGLLLLNVATILHRAELTLDPAYDLKVNHQPAPAPAPSFKLTLKARR